MSETVTDTGQNPPIFSLRSRRFWLVQIVGWSLLHFITSLPVHELALQFGGTTGEVIFLGEFGAVLGILVSTGLGWIFLRVPERFIRGATAVILVVVLCILGAGLALLAQFALMQKTGIGFWSPPSVTDGLAIPAFFLFDTITTLCAWSALFLMVLGNKRIRRERERALAASRLANEAQLALLRSQLNPHFLFNALNSVVGLISEDSKRAELMVKDIAALLRRSLDGTTKNCTVADELEFINLYLRCQKVRFEEKLQVEVDVQEEILRLPFPSMLMHPLVENAVKFGMRGGNPLQLKISGRTDGKRLIFEVANSGELDTEVRSTYSGTGTGVKTVRERIEAMFPDDGEFDLSEREGWVIASIRYTPSSSSVEQ